MPTTQTPTPSPEPVWPLTGLPAPGGVPDRPALIVKVDNTRNARPQVGLSSADLIVEELVEGGLTRLAVFYHSSLPEVVGPVRSVRTTDIGTVAPADGILAASGGAGRVMQQIDEAGLTVLSEGDDGFSRARDRSAPYNLMLDPEAALADVTQPTLSEPYLPWGPAPTGGEPATNAEASFSRAHTTQWTWSDGVWHREGNLAASDDAFTPTSLLIVRVAVRDAGYRDPAGNPVPESVLEGSGEAVLLTGGRAYAGRWTKQSADASFGLTAANGRPLQVPPGKTWIELLPTAGDLRLS